MTHHSRRKQALRQVTAVMLGWEFVAIELDIEKMPTFSTIAGTHQWLAPTLLIALAVHLWWPLDGQRRKQLFL